MVELGRTKRQIIQTICQNSKEVLVRGTAEGALGRAWVANLEIPTHCLIQVGDFAYVLGIPPKGQNAMDLTTQICKLGSNTFLTPENELWAEWLQGNIEGKFRLVSRYSLRKEDQHFDAVKLKEYKKQIPEGMQIKQMDKKLYHLALKEDWSRDFCTNFDDVEHFLEAGLGFVVMKEKILISGCSAYGISNGMMEVEVGTRKEYRRQGIALACCATFIEACLKRKIFPNWDAANLKSVGLAEKLGYTFDKEYTVYQLTEEW